MGELIDIPGATDKWIDNLIRRGQTRAKELGIDPNAHPDRISALVSAARCLEMHGISIKHVVTVSVPADTSLSVEELDDLVMDALDVDGFEVEYEFINPRVKRRRRRLQRN